MQVTLNLHYDALLVIDSMSAGGTERDGQGHPQGGVYQMLMNRHGEKEHWPSIPLV